MQAVCYIHDKCYWYGGPVIADWYLSNEMFMSNMVSAVFAQRTRAVNAIENGDLYRAVTYYTAVDLSPAGYIRVKERQGHDLTGFYK